MKGAADARLRKKSPGVPRDAAWRRALHLLNTAATLLEQGHAEEAIPLLQRALQMDEASVPLLLNVGGAYVITGLYREATPLLEAARDAEPDNAMVWINLGAAYLGNPVLATAEQRACAQAAFERAVELDPTAPKAHYNLGLIYVDQGEPDRACEAFRQAIQSDPSDRDAHVWLQRLTASSAGGEPAEPSSQRRAPEASARPPIEIGG